MKILQLHSDYIIFEPIKKEIEDAEPFEKKRVRLKDLLVLFTCIEKDDEETSGKIAIDEVDKSAKVLKVRRILIYPYAHLSDSLANPKRAKRVLKLMEEYAKEKGFEVFKAPFGWCKSFSLKIKSHPLAEQFKTIYPKKVAKKEVEIKKEYLILTQDGRLIPPEDYEFKNGEEEFKILVEKEALGKGLEGGEPEYIEHMKKFGFEWEPMSDVGHMRYGPYASLIFDLVSAYSKQITKSLGIPVYSVKGTNMFNLDLDAIREHAELFGSRMYKVDVENKSFVMRYSACFQQFAMIKDWQLSYRNLPFGAFEVADSYRLEQSGELLLCFRTRRMNMPDLHVFCKDMEEAKKWFFEIHKKIYEEIRKLGRDYYSLYNLTSKEFFERNKEWFLELVRYEKKPVLLCFYPKGINYYWLLNIEYHIIDKMNRPREIGTVQIDVGNSKRFGIKFTDKNGKDVNPIILHTAIIGTIERFLYTIFDTVLRMKNPTLPLWLSPTQVRICPVSDDYLSYSIKVAEALEKENIRVDVDDRRETVERKIRDAEINWIPLQIVIGKNEVETNLLPVRFRETCRIEKLKLNEIVKYVKEKTKGYPFLPLDLPNLLSQRPSF